jgi:hypothetical protein
MTRGGTKKPKRMAQASTSLQAQPSQGILDWVAVGTRIMMVPPSEGAKGSMTRSSSNEIYLIFGPQGPVEKFRKNRSFTRMFSSFRYVDCPKSKMVLGISRTF